MKFRLFSRVPAVASGALVGLLLATAVTVAWRLHIRREHQRLAEMREAAATQIAYRIRWAIDHELNATDLLLALWKHGHLRDSSDFNFHVGTFIRYFKGFHSVSFIDSTGVYRWVLPRENSRRLLGVDVRQIPVVRRVYEATRLSKEPALWGPIKFPDGSVGVLHMLPLWRNGRSAGLIECDLDVGATIRETLDRGVDSRYNVRIWSDRLLLADVSSLPFGWSESQEVSTVTIWENAQPWDVQVQFTPVFARRLESRGGTWLWLIGLLSSLGYGALVGVLTARVRDLRHRQRQVQELEEQVRAFMEQREVPLGYLEGEELVMANQALADLFKTPVENLLGKGWWNFLAEEHLELARDRVRRRRQNLPIPDSTNVVFVDAEGNRLHVEVFTTELVLGGKRLVQVLLKDRTEEEQALQQLVESEERYRSLVNALRELIFLVDADLTIKLFNPAGLPDFPKNEDLVGKRLKEVLPQSAVKPLVEAAERVLKTAGSALVDVEVESREGKRTYQVQLAPLQCGARVTGVTGVGRDITELRRIEKVLREERDFNRLLIESAQMLIVVADADGKIVTVNRAIEGLLGVDRKNILGRMWDDVFRMPDSVSTAASFESLCGRASKEAVEVKVRGAGGRTHEIRWHLSFLNQEGEHKRCLFVGEDVTEENRLRAQLFEAQKMETIGTLAGGVAHDFNNILTSVLGYASLILAECDSTYPFRSEIEAIKKAGERGASVVRQLLSFARRSPESHEMVDLGGVIRETCQLLRGSLPSTIRLEVEIEDDLPPVEGEATKIEQVLMNLAVNGRDAMPEGGILRISARSVHGDDVRTVWPEAPSKPLVELTVSDTGQGIPEEIRARIFEPFFSTKEKGKGTGLGLSVVYGIVKAHGGWISVESEVGEGTTFRIYLPAAKRTARQQRSEEETDMQSGGKGRVLVVDDEESIREIAKRVLTRSGFEVVTASSGDEAVELFREDPDFDVVLLDLTMPGMSSAECMRKLREIKPEIRVVVASGYADGETVTEVMRAGADRFIQKPFHPLKLVAELKKSGQS